MTGRTVRTSAILFALAVLPTGVSRSADPNAPAVMPEANEDLRIQFRGRVTEVTNKTITIKPEGNVTLIGMEFRGGGVFRTRVYVQDNSKPPRKFRFTDEFLASENWLPLKPGQLGIPLKHRITDVMVGDLVEIECRDIKGTDYCIEIEIHRRLNGKVPPARDEFFSDAHRLHNRMNAEQAIEEQIFPKLPRLFTRFHP